MTTDTDQEDNCIACGGTGINTKGGMCKACNGVEVPEVLRLKPPMQPYWLAMGNMAEQREQAEQALAYVRGLNCNDETRNMLRAQCQEEIKKLTARRDEITKPLRDAIVVIEKPFEEVIRVYARCDLHLIDKGHR